MFVYLPHSKYIFDRAFCCSDAYVFAPLLLILACTRGRIAVLCNTSNALENGIIAKSDVIISIALDLSTPRVV